MGFFDKLKGAVHAVTGGAATVEIQYTEIVSPGATVPVRVTMTAKGNEVKSKGVFVDFTGLEKIAVSKRDDSRLSDDYHKETAHSTQEFQLCGELVLAPNETKVVEGTITIPTNLQPSYDGKHTHNLYQVRGRLEARGNDPDSGYKPLRVIVRG